MRLILPLPLRRFLLGRLLFSVTMATAASGAEFVVDAAQAANPGQHVYNTLQELADSGALSSGDTVILHNDDSSLTAGLPVAVNFRSNDPGIFRTIDLAGLGEREVLYDFSGAGLNDITLEMNSIILSGSVNQLTRSMTFSSLMIEGKVQFDRNCVENRRDNVDRIAIALLYSSHRGEILKLGDGVIFSNNCVLGVDNRSARGGVLLNSSISPITIGDHAVFSGNYAFSNLNGAFGGVFYSARHRSVGMGFHGEIAVGANATFINNYAFSNSTTASGGVICSSGDISFSDGATFINNYAKTSGGAIELAGKLDLLALTKDVLFSGNMTGGVFTRHDDGTFSVENGVANAIHLTTGATIPESAIETQGSLALAAEEGREIRFNDPITSRSENSDCPMTLTLNRCTDEEGNIHDTDGTIIFSSELYQGEEAHLVASRYNNFVADTTLYGGTLLLEHGAVFGRNLEDMRNLGNDSSSLTVEKGTLEIIGGSTANAAAFSLSGRDAVLRPGDSAFINANTADFSRGFTFDMRHQLQSGPGSGPGLTLSAAQSFTAGGLIGVADTGSNAPYFYADRSWKQDRVFHVLTDAEHTLQGNFDGVVSQATGTDRVDSPYSYTGTWSHRWTDADGDGYAEQLQLVWKADGTPISSIDPELVGELAFNSLWSSASNAAALGGNVLSRLNVFRLADKHARDLWGMGLGDFARQRSRGGADGYDYSGGGYSVGADSGFGHDNGIWGIAFGQLYGHAKSRGFQGRNTQDTRMGSLYWGRLLEESRRARWTFKGSLTWAETHNKMTSRLSGAPASTGKWNNETWLAQAEVSRTADYAGGWRLTPFLRVEFTHGRQDAFREQGGYGRDFGGAALKRLSIPVGLEIGRTDEWKGRPWAQALRVSYVGDVLQDVPEGTVYSPYSDMSWRGRAVSPERHGFRAEYNTSLQCNERWSVYGGYGLEVRGSSCYHRVNAGVSRSF